MIKVAAGNVQCLPVRVPFENLAVNAEEGIALNRGFDRLPHFLLRRPDVAQEDRLAVATVADRFGFPVEIDLAGEGVSDDERRRGQVIRPHLGMHAALEVAVAAEHGGDDEPVASGSAGSILSGSGPLLPMQVVQP